MENIEQIHDDFTNILSKDELIKLAEKYDIVDKRTRLLPITTFFWLMVLSAFPYWECFISYQDGYQQEAKST